MLLFVFRSATICLQASAPYSSPPFTFLNSRHMIRHTLLFRLPNRGGSVFARDFLKAAAALAKSLLRNGLRLFACLPGWAVFAAAPGSENPSDYLQFIRASAAQLRAADQPPLTKADWEQQRARLRENLERAWGGFPAAPCSLEPRTLSEFKRDGYRVEKVIFQTRPNIWMTANAYVPERSGKLPAVVCVHGHWRGAKQDPVVQSRCIGLAKLGFFVLAVDAFGAGERAVGKALGEYHGEMTAATLWPIGLPLSGLQVYENMRAVDYLLTRAEVDAARVGITGASGGGNQTMYAGAWDERFVAVVPVCSVGNYQAYLGNACCMCEVVPGALQFTEEWGLLSQTAPRALMVINATKDSVPFSVGKAEKSLTLAQSVFDLYGQRDQLKHAVFESPHAYNEPIREAMYGWMTRHLKREGSGAPIAEPEIKTEDPETLRCFPGQSRPDDFVTIPKFAAAEARNILSRRRPPASAREWQGEAERRRAALVNVLGSVPPAVPLNLKTEPTADGKARVLSFTSETGLTLTTRFEAGARPSAPLAVVLDCEGAEKSMASEVAGELRGAGWSLAFPELRATGRFANPRERVGRSPDHHSAQWALWLGRPLLGQWSVDVRRALDAIAEHDGKLSAEIAAVGFGPAGLVAICSATLDTRITRVATLGMLASYVTDGPYESQRMGIMAPGILRDPGDIPHLAALLAPRRLLISGGVDGRGEMLSPPVLREQFTFTRQVYDMSNVADALAIVPDAGPIELVRELKR